MGGFGGIDEPRRGGGLKIFKIAKSNFYKKLCNVDCHLCTKVSATKAMFLFDLVPL